MNYAKIKHFDIANGKGIRESLFLTGCKIHCKGCFNKDIWDYNSGIPFSKDTIDNILFDFKNPNIKGFSLLGGEPFGRKEQDTNVLIELIQSIKKIRQDIDFWCWSGYLFENLITDSLNLSLLSEFDILIDGEFKEELKDYNLKYRGSTNQRIINVKESLKKNKVITLNF